MSVRVSRSRNLVRWGEKHNITHADDHDIDSSPCRDDVLAHWPSYGQQQFRRSFRRDCVNR